MENHTVKANPIDAFLAQVKENSNSKKAVQAKAVNPEGIFGEINRYAVLIAVILVCGCLGGTAVALGALASTTQIALLIFPMMIALSMSLAVAPMKYVVYSAIGAAVIDVAVILYHVLG